MRHVIIDTARTYCPKGNYRKRRRGKIWPKDLQKEKMKPFDTIEQTKSMSDRLRPFQRYLLKREGQPWNDVFSDICRSADLRNIRGFHLRSHIEDFVHLHTYYVGKTLMYQSKIGIRPLKSRENFIKFYVDSNGILRKAP